MPLRLEALPFGPPPDTHRTSGPRLLAASGIALVMALALLPGLASPSSAAARPAARPATQAPAAAPAVTLTTTAKACARKKRKAVRKACRAQVRRAQRARVAQARRARAVAVRNAQTARGRALAARAAASRARAVAARTSHKQCKAKKRAQVRKKCHRAVRKQNRVLRSSASRAAAATRSAQRTHQIAMRAVGRPPFAYSPAPGSYFSYPNKSGRMKRAIRSRLLAAIRSTWGGPRDGSRCVRQATGRSASRPGPSMTSRSPGLWWARTNAASVSRSLRPRSANRDHRAWRWLRHRLGARPTNPSVRQSADRVSFARQCRGSCRGGGGTPHAKYMLIDKVGPAQARRVVDPGLDEPDQDGLSRAVEPGAGHAFSGGVRRLHEGLQASEAGRKGRDAVPHGRTGARRQLLLPTASGDCGRGPRDAGLERCAVPICQAGRGREGTHQDPDRAVRHARDPWGLDRQATAEATECRMQHRDHLFGRQPPRPRDPSQSARPRADPHAAVGPARSVRVGQWLQPREVDDDPRRVGIPHGRRPDPQRFRQLVQRSVRQ